MERESVFLMNIESECELLNLLAWTIFCINDEDPVTCVRINLPAHFSDTRVT